MKSYDHFKRLSDLVDCINVALCMVWWNKPQTQVEYDAFDFIRHLCMLHKIENFIREVTMVT
jgi:hypothetical protein